MATSSILLSTAAEADPGATASLTPTHSLSNGLALSEIIQKVLDQNESIFTKMLEAEISEKTIRSEKGIFEPQVVGSVDRTDSQRQNNSQQVLSLGLSATGELLERNTIYNGGLEFLAPSGAKIRTGYTLRELVNNLQRAGQEYETFIGVSVEQPLLKNFGPAATMARIRLAALASDIAFQEYRKQLMIVLSQAQAAYWELYLTQEQERISSESVNLAQKIFRDNKARNELGKASQLEVLEAQAALALRQSRQAEARQKRYEGGNRLVSFFSDITLDRENIRALDQPSVREVPLTFSDNSLDASQWNPDYLARQKQLRQEEVRLKYAQNQRLPQFNLKGSYGFNGLGSTPNASWDVVGRGQEAAWSVGVELRVPVLGGIKERADLDVAKLSLHRAQIAVKDILTQISNALDSTLHRVRNYKENVESFREVVDFHEKLLKSQLTQLDLGGIDNRTVLETEEKLFEARISALDSLVSYQKALLELNLIKGVTLLTLNLEISKAQLHDKTMAMLQQKQWTDRMVQDLQKPVLEAMDPSAVDHERAVQVLRDEIQRQRQAEKSELPPPR